VALYALFELGIPAVLLHPRFTANERNHLIEMMGIRLVIDERWTEPTHHAPPAGPREIDSEAPLAILFTSGTSGTPKGVALSRRAFRASAAASARNLGWRDDDRWAVSSPIAHAGGLSVIVRCLLACKPVVLSPWTASLDRVFSDIESCRITMLSLSPAMLARILDHDPNYRLPPYVRLILLGGDTAPSRLLDRAAERGMPVLTTYGLTEACSQVATQRLGERPSAAAGVGFPIDGVEVRLVGGEIQVRGPTMMTGYLPRGRWPSLFLDGGWFPTGDLGKLDSDGRLHIQGRATDLIISGGENVDPIEVERVLLSIPNIRGACVFGMPSEEWGQIVVGAVALFESCTLEVDAIVAVLAERLAKFKRPRALAIVQELCVNANGKVDRKRIASAKYDFVPLPSTR
jgi:O-succinylbenzoic acid--CoA ligase